MTISSDSTANIYAALVKFKAAVGPIRKTSEVKVATRTGGSYTFKYADLSEIDSAIRKPLTDNGLTVTQLVGGPGSLTTLLVHSSGEYLGTTSSIPVPDNATKQDIGGTITYLRRYAISAILGIVTDDDVDAAPADVVPKAPVKRQQKTAAAAPAPTEAPGKLPFTGAIKDAMVSSLKNGDVERVQGRLQAYDVPAGDLFELNQLINEAKKKLEAGANANA